MQKVEIEWRKLKLNWLSTSGDHELRVCRQNNRKLLYVIMSVKNVQTDVITSHGHHKLILISALFTPHFHPHFKKETIRNKSQMAKCKILDWQSNMKNVLKQKHFLLNRESSVIKVLWEIFFKPFFCLFLYFSRLRGHRSSQIYLTSHPMKLKIIKPAVKRDEKMQ